MSNPGTYLLMRAITVQLLSCVSFSRPCSYLLVPSIFLYPLHRGRIHEWCAVPPGYQTFHFA